MVYVSEKQGKGQRKKERVRGARSLFKTEVFFHFILLSFPFNLIFKKMPVAPGGTPATDKT
jgi:hypothetical protein